MNGRRGNLWARIERLERLSDPMPEMLVTVLAEGETKEEARARVIAEGRAGPHTVVVCLEPEDANL